MDKTKITPIIGLYRGKRKDNGKWVEGGYYHIHKTTHCFSNDDIDNDIHRIMYEEMTDWDLPNRHLMVDVIPETVGQFIDLIDNTGKRYKQRIFVGDIIKFNAYGREYVGVVSIVNGNACVSCNGDVKVSPYLDTVVFNYEDVTIIGNIYDNSEIIPIDNRKLNSNDSSILEETRPMTDEEQKIYNNFLRSGEKTGVRMF